MALASPPQLFAYLSRFKSELRVDNIKKRGFAHAGISRKNVYSSAKAFFYAVDALAVFTAHQKGFDSGFFINIQDFRRVGKIGFTHHNNWLDFSVLGYGADSVDNKGVRSRVDGGNDNPKTVGIGNRRAFEKILSVDNAFYHAFAVFRRFYFGEVAHKRRDLIFAKHPSCLAFINLTVCLGIIKSRNCLYYNGSHCCCPSPLFLSFSAL